MNTKTIAYVLAVIIALAFFGLPLLAMAAGVLGS